MPLTCVICGEEILPTDESAEMHDPMLDDPEMFSEAEAGVVHANCGVAKGWSIS